MAKKNGHAVVTSTGSRRNRGKTRGRPKKPPQSVETRNEITRWRNKATEAGIRGLF